MPPPHEGAKCHPCVRNTVLPMSQEEHENSHNTKRVRELAESSAVLAICLASPHAGFCTEVGTKVVTAKPRLSDANHGGCRKPAARTGYTRRRAGARGDLYVR